VSAGTGPCLPAVRRSGERSRIDVVAAVVERSDGSFLLAQRPAGKVYAGYWEFPGGKIEPGEAHARALGRELHEELGIDVEQAYPWLTRDYDYEHAAVRLHFLRVARWRGEPYGREGQQFAWQRAGRLDVAPVLPANGPILRALELPQVYGVSAASTLGTPEFLRRLEAALAHDLRLVQLREPELAASEQASLARQIIALAQAHGARVLLNALPAVAAAAGADGVHLTTARLMASAARPDLPLVGASCHNARELAHAAALGLDFVVLGPVAPTPSHPGATVLGWAGFAALVEGYSLPVFAIGGLSPADLPQAWSAGAHGIAAIRGAFPAPTQTI
jgi:8-oxo-dGTP diphosphatase